LIIKHMIDPNSITELLAENRMDNVNNPAHYGKGSIECIDYIKQQLGDQFGVYLLGNCHKYLHRHKYKGSALEDLKKAQWYLNKLIGETK